MEFSQEILVTNKNERVLGVDHFCVFLRRDSWGRSAVQFFALTGSKMRFLRTLRGTFSDLKVTFAYMSRYM